MSDPCYLGSPTDSRLLQYKYNLKVVLRRQFWFYTIKNSFDFTETGIILKVHSDCFTSTDFYLGNDISGF